MVLYMNEYSKLMEKKDLKDFEGRTLEDLLGALQFSAF